jgi:serine/threonine protein kinase
LLGEGGFAGVPRARPGYGPRGGGQTTARGDRRAIWLRSTVTSVRWKSHAPWILRNPASDSNAPYMVLQYIEGQSLRAYLSAHGPLPTQEVRKIGLQLAVAMQYIHDQGLSTAISSPSTFLSDPTAA